MVWKWQSFWKKTPVLIKSSLGQESSLCLTTNKWAVHIIVVVGAHVVVGGADSTEVKYGSVCIIIRAPVVCGLTNHVTLLGFPLESAERYHFHNQGLLPCTSTYWNMTKQFAKALTDRWMQGIGGRAECAYIELLSLSPVWHLCSAVLAANLFCWVSPVRPPPSRCFEQHV